jgi:hypothetical protein
MKDPLKRPEARADPVAGALWLGLLALVLTRAMAASATSRELWGFDVQRFLAAVPAWVPWALAAATLIPPVARRVAPAFLAFGAAIERRPWIAALIAAGVAVAMVAAFPDRLRYVGDFLLRIGAVRQEESPDVLSPQVFPLDVLVHYGAPLAADRAGWMGAEAAVRVIGAIDAALLAVFAVLLARSLGGGPAARAAACATVLFSGCLCLYTGESKAFGEMVVAVVGFAAFALAMLPRRASVGELPPIASSRGAKPRARSAQVDAVGHAVPNGGAVLGAGLCLGIGILFHRFALGLVPAWLVAVFLWLRAGRERALRSLPSLLGLAVPVVVIAVMAPRLWTTVTTYDLGVNFAATEAGRPGALGVALAPSHVLDVLNLLGFLSPLALVAIVLLPTAAASSWRGVASARAGETAFMLALVVPFGLVLLIARPPQGPLRDWDSFATPAAALSVGAAWWIARAIDRSRREWLAVSVVVVSAASAFQWLSHFADAPRARARLEALMTGPPARSAVDRARTWDFLGWGYFRERAFDRAAHAFEQASDAAPSPSNLAHWAMAETMGGRHERALDLYSEAVGRDSNYTLGWFGVGVSAINSGNPAQAARAARALGRLAPENPKTREIVRWLEAHHSQPALGAPALDGKRPSAPPIQKQ